MGSYMHFTALHFALTYKLHFPIFLCAHSLAALQERGCTTYHAKSQRTRYNSKSHFSKRSHLETWLNENQWIIKPNFILKNLIEWQSTSLRWVPINQMESHEFQYISGIYCVPAGCHRFLMDSHGFLRIPENENGFPWSVTDPYGCVKPSMGFQRF